MTENNNSTERANYFEANNHVNHNNNTQPILEKLKIQLPTQNENHTPTNAATATNTKPMKKKRRDKSDLGENFVAPDGGWGWLVTMAAGANILVSFAVAQQFGIIFRDHMLRLGISSSQLTTIINMQVAVSAFTGLLNGPLFRRYSYRQVALVGAIFSSMGLFLSVFAASFLFYVCSFSCLYGFGRGLTVSAGSLAVNTFFKQKRRTATAYQFGVAGLGPIFLPYLATFLLHFYGVQGTVLIFSAVSLHTIACALVYQPVKWHVRPIVLDEEAVKRRIDEEEEIENIAEPETPILPRANDGWYGSRLSLYTPTCRSRFNSIGKRCESGHELQLLNSKEHINKENINSRECVRGKARSISVTYSIQEEDDYAEHEEQSDKAAVADVHKHLLERTVLNHNPPVYATSNYINAEDETMIPKRNMTAQAELEAAEDAERQNLPFYKKIAIFFDLDLLRDITYVNLAFGLTLINFAEINFAILTPFILSDFGFKDSQIALAMSLLGSCDLVIRFLIPVITARMKFSNKSFFMVGIIGMCIGRTFLSFTRDFYFMITIFVWMGLNKAFRTVFWSLIIPSYVPLKRLPAAAGLQLLMSGIFSMACGPLIGLIRDKTNFAFTLNFLNGLCIFALLFWVAEFFYRKQHQHNVNTESTTRDVK